MIETARGKILNAFLGKGNILDKCFVHLLCLRKWIAKYKWLEQKHDTFSNLYHKLSQEWLKYFLSQRIPFTALLAEGCNSNLSREKYLPGASCSIFRGRPLRQYQHLLSFAEIRREVNSPLIQIFIFIINIPSLKWLFQNCFIALWYVSKWKWNLSSHYK